MFWDHKSNTPMVTMTDLKDLSSCNAQSVSQSVIDIINKHGIDPKRCSV